jgi:hypothetical protein
MFGRSANEVSKFACLNASFMVRNTSHRLLSAFLTFRKIEGHNEPGRLRIRLGCVMIWLKIA